jgi:Na+-transporting NADH:ubiquinone oxidoreductase subunit C
VPKLESTRYTVLFATVVCVVCALVVAVSAVGLAERQDANARLYRQKNVLLAAGLVKPGEDPSAAEIGRIFAENIRVGLIDLKTGAKTELPGIDPTSYDQRKVRNDTALSHPAPPNNAGLARLPNVGAVYYVTGQGGTIEQVVLPVEGTGMWGQLAGFIALDRDGNTVRGLTFYEQKETPGLGGEISNPKWQALWQGRRAYDANWEPKLTVVKGKAGPPEKDPHRIDALSGATITSNSVARLMAFWFSDAGYGPYLKRFRQGAAT